MIVYHYTSKASFDEIMQSKEIRPSDPWTTMDAAYGQGWYFTDLLPNNCDAWTAAHCWKSLAVFSKLEYYLKFEIPDDILINCRNHVFMVDIWDDRIGYLEGKETPKCSKAPCMVCDVIVRVKQFLGL